MDQFNNYVVCKEIERKLESGSGDVIGDILQLNLISPQILWFLTKNFPKNLKTSIHNRVKYTIRTYEDNLPVYLDLYKMMLGKKKLNFENFEECISKFTFLGNNDKRYFIRIAHKIQFGEEPEDELLEELRKKYDAKYREYTLTWTLPDDDEGESV